MTVLGGRCSPMRGETSDFPSEFLSSLAPLGLHILYLQIASQLHTRVESSLCSTMLICFAYSMDYPPQLLSHLRQAPQLITLIIIRCASSDNPSYSSRITWGSMMTILHTSCIAISLLNELLSVLHSDIRNFLKVLRVATIISSSVTRSPYAP